MIADLTRSEKVVRLIYSDEDRRSRCVNGGRPLAAHAVMQAVELSANLDYSCPMFAQ